VAVILRVAAAAAAVTAYVFAFSFIADELGYYGRHDSQQNQSDY
jgi:hypothetical protein